MVASKLLSFDKYISLKSEHVIAQSFWIVTFTALTAIGAQLEIATRPVPYTLQTLFVILAGALLGSRRGAASMLLYLGVGALGVPVFASGGLGLAKLIGPTGGYLLAFPLAAYLTGALVSKSSHIAWTVVAMVSGMLVIFACGSIFLSLFYLHNVMQSLVSGFFIFTWWDALKIAAAVAICRQFGQTPLSK